MRFTDIYPRPIRRPPRRSERRLGMSQTQILEQNLRQPRLTLTSAQGLWPYRPPQLMGSFLLLILFLSLYLLFMRETFYVYGAAIGGNRAVTMTEIYTASEIHNMSVFWIDPDSIKAKVEALPHVKQADVWVRLPAQVTITVEEHEPELIWQTGEQTWWVDNEGTVVPPRLDQDNDVTRLHIIDSDAQPIQSNDKIDPMIIESAYIIKQHKPNLEALHYSQSVGLIYVSAQGWPIYLGNSTNIRAKLRVAEAVQADLVAQTYSPSFIDVRNPQRVIYRSQNGY